MLSVGRCTSGHGLPVWWPLGPGPTGAPQHSWRAPCGLTCSSHTTSTPSPNTMINTRALPLLHVSVWSGHSRHDLVTPGRGVTCSQLSRAAGKLPLPPAGCYSYLVHEVEQQLQTGRRGVSEGHLIPPCCLFRPQVNMAWTHTQSDSLATEGSAQSPTAAPERRG